MKFLVVATVFFITCSQALAGGGKIHLSGTVHEKVDVKAENGKLHISKNSPRLKVVVDKRLPASVVRVQAP